MNAEDKMFSKKTLFIMWAVVYFAGAIVWLAAATILVCRYALAAWMVGK